MEIMLNNTYVYKTHQSILCKKKMACFFNKQLLRKTTCCITFWKSYLNPRILPVCAFLSTPCFCHTALVCPLLSSMPLCVTTMEARIFTALPRASNAFLGGFCSQCHTHLKQQNEVTFFFFSAASVHLFQQEMINAIVSQNIPFKGWSQKTATLRPVSWR